MKKFFFIFLVFYSCTVFAQTKSKISFPDIIGNDMVLQQSSEVTLWGWGPADEKIEVTTSWGDTSSCIINKKGEWFLKVKTPKGSFIPQNVTFKCGEKITFNHVLIGEVWLGSGQSNMEMPIVGYGNCPVEGALEIVAMADEFENSIHFVNISHAQSRTKEDKVNGKWVATNSETVSNFSALGYFFSTKLSKILNVPIGFINCSWGGSRVESWLSQEILETYTNPSVSLDEKSLSLLKHEYQHPMKMYNAMLHPLRHYSIRGFLFYQGESNVGNANNYAERLRDMVSLWRKTWQNNDLPFYYVQIAPFLYTGVEAGTAAYFREAQSDALDMIPNSGMVSTIDLVKDYEDINIHPSDKCSVGYRLAYMASNKTYGRKYLWCDSPAFQNLEVKDGVCYLKFSNTKYGFNRQNSVSGFEVAGKDGVYYPASTKPFTGPNYEIKLKVWSDKVKNPVYVRYCFTDCPNAVLANTVGLPVLPFRSSRK